MRKARQDGAWTKKALPVCGPLANQCVAAISFCAVASFSWNATPGKATYCMPTIYLQPATPWIGTGV